MKGAPGGDLTGAPFLTNLLKRSSMAWILLNASVLAAVDADMSTMSLPTSEQ